MRRIFIILAGLVVIGLVGGILSLGIFPPTPVVSDVHKDLPASNLAASSPAPVAPAVALPPPSSPPALAPAQPVPASTAAH